MRKFAFIAAVAVAALSANVVLAQTAPAPAPAPAAAPAPQAQSIEGLYSLAGVNVDKSTYSGTVEVKKIGGGYQILWDLGSEKVYGAGLLDGTTLVVGTVYEKKSIVATMKPDGANFKGPWYQRGEKAFGEEVWLKR